MPTPRSQELIGYDPREHLPDKSCRVLVLTKSSYSAGTVCVMQFDQDRPLNSCWKWYGMWEWSSTDEIALWAPLPTLAVEHY